jgi:hypothetical protein
MTKTWVVDIWMHFAHGGRDVIKKNVSADSLYIDRGCLIFSNDQLEIIKMYNSGEWISVELLED